MKDHGNQSRDLGALPKAELHLHLEGAMRRSTLVELCTKYKLPIPTDTARQRFKDFSGFVDVYVAACQCLKEEADIRRLVREVAEDAKKSGAVWIEVAPSFTFYADKFGGLRETLKLLVDAAEEAEKVTSVGIGYVISVERHLSLEEAKKLAEIAKKGAENLRICGRAALVGFGLHGPEEGYPPSQFKDVFERACSPLPDDSDNNRVSVDDDIKPGSRLVSLPHAGEIAPSPGQGAQSVIDAITSLKAKRIAHGVLAVDNEDAILAIINANVCLDVCVSSNYMLNVVPTLQSHPIVKLLQRGIPVTINSDDPLLFGYNLLDEYDVCRKELNMDDNMLAACAKFSFEHSCAPDDLKRKYIDEIDVWLKN